MWNAGLDESQARNKIAGRNINNIRYADDTTLMAQSENKLKRLLMRVKEKNEKAGLKLNIQKTKITESQSHHFMVKSGNIDRFYFPVLRNHSSHEIKTLSPWQEDYDKPRQCIKKQRHHFADKGLYSHSYGSSSSHVQMWELDHKEDWVPNNCCFRRLLRVSWTARRSN